MIEARGVSKSFKTTQALAHIALDVQGGEIVGLIGPNGAGKTTLFRILGGILKADSGQVRIAGRDPYRHRRQIFRHLGIVPETRSLYLRLTVYEHLYLFGAFHDLSPTSLKRRIHDLSATLNLASLLTTPYQNLSQGQQVRLAFARALIHDPQILLLDEPTRGLDMLGVRDIHSLILQKQRQGACILLSSHIPREIQTLCSRLILLGQGRILAAGALDDLRTQTGLYHLEDIFYQLAS